MKCPSCGAETRNDVCEYCGCEVPRNSNDIHVTHSFEMDPESKEQFKRSAEGNKTFGKIYIIVFLVIVFFSIGFFVFIAFNMFKVFSNRNTMNMNNESIVSENNDFQGDIDFDEVQESTNIKIFNSSIELYRGTQKGTAISFLLNDVLSNKLSKRSIQIKYGETTTGDANEISEMSSQFDDFSDYDISFEYDDEGYINLITIEDKSE